MLFIFIIGITYLASLALMTPYLQTLMGYPVVTAGLVMGPRGLGTMTLHVPRRPADRASRYPLLIVFGLLLTAWAMYDMTGWTPGRLAVDDRLAGFIQGAGLGFLFVPLDDRRLRDLAPSSAPKAPVCYNLSRNVGSSVGISIVT